MLANPERDASGIGGHRLTGMQCQQAGQRPARPFSPSLVPRLCLGTRFSRGSASRRTATCGGATGELRPKAEPWNEVDVLANPERDASGIGGHRRTGMQCQRDASATGPPFSPSLVPRLCLGTRSSGGSASRRTATCGRATGELRPKAEPWNEVDVLANPERDASEIGGHRLTGMQCQRDASATGPLHSPSLVPRLCLGTRFSGGSASRRTATCGRATGELRPKAEPWNEVDVLANPERDASEIGGHRLTGMQCQRDASATGPLHSPLAHRLQSLGLPNMDTAGLPGGEHTVTTGTDPQRKQKIARR
ncbi:hypothetical protein Mal15_12500 [Stieleria maiorica]|uniref:Uncharacterized protein n=1 Tax=Stieleria maiorica TaxID=2795974 RepID=A0A5B9M7U6_9BACT|nr:hypothetical protein Mal15_12500 [Stieleria maiorica]